ncbi:MAG: hypothetical protein IPQ16_04950 [Geobacteraceae bacterium]|nr:hypothetical protein [Geobacteraceae bacterium]
MTALYMVIIFSPLLPFAMHSAGAAQVTVRECSGDCNLCGCSPESRVSNTCCCSKMRQQTACVHEDEEDTDDCCKNDSSAKKTVIACGCPCGSQKQDALSTGGSSEILPYHFTDLFSPHHAFTSFTSFAHRLTSRHGEPPDPPPERA